MDLYSYHFQILYYFPFVSIYKISILDIYIVIQYPGGFPSIRELRMSLLGDRPSTLAQEPATRTSGFFFLLLFSYREKKVTKRFEIKEELELKSKLVLRINVELGE
jgi:hypothetical protein